LIDSREARERKKASLALGRFLAVARIDSGTIKARFSPIVGESVGGSRNSPMDLERAERMLLVISSLFYADPELGVWSLGDGSEEDNSQLPLVLALGSSPIGSAQVCSDLKFE